MILRWAHTVQFSITVWFGVNAFFPSLVCVSWVIPVVMSEKSMILHVYCFLCLQQQVARFLSEIVACLGFTACVNRSTAETIFLIFKEVDVFKVTAVVEVYCYSWKWKTKAKHGGGEYTFLRFASACIFVCLACNCVPFTTGQSSFFGLLLCCYLLVPLTLSCKTSCFCFSYLFLPSLICY